MFTGVDQQHLTHALRALLLQQSVKLLTAPAEMGVAAVTEGDNAIARIGLIAQRVFDCLEERHNAVWQIALPGC
ncbi:hypothetical protein D3C81_2182390 [compost metagenome]